MNLEKYKNFARTCRIDILNMIYSTKSAFIGSCFSSVDILSVLYNGFFEYRNGSDERDMFLLSKGHAAAALYATLANMNVFPKERLNEFCREDSLVGVHLKKHSLPGIETSSGSLGHGLGLGCGIACADKITNSPARTYVLMGDGECNEGSVWEASMFASRHNLNNLTVIVDRNRLQSYEHDEKVLNMNDMALKFSAFGFNAININGHDCMELHNAFSNAISCKDKPTAIIANTVKGKGVSFMEDKVVWHYKWPDENEYIQALEELNK